MLDRQPLELSRDYKYALDLLEKTVSNVFITGRAGTGKSTLLKLFCDTTRKKVVVLAPTGVAALNVKGQTIHSFFGFPPRMLNKKDIKKRRNRKIYKALEVLVIDEISMVRADLFDNMDYFLRINRDNPAPFGGVQIVCFGDLFQLPPVLSSETEKMFFKLTYDSPYFFSAKVFEEVEMEMVELQKVYRQEARLFIRLLDAVRTNQADYDDLEDLNERYFPDFEPEDFYITISPRNAQVESINRKELNKLDTPEFIFLANITGDFNPRLFPTDAALKLKEGAQVMFLKNDPKKQFVNGTIGKITRLSRDSITVVAEEYGKKKTIEVEPFEWEILKYKISEKDPNELETEVMGTFKQYPIKFAWAITIHKSQGKTFEKVIIDMGRGAFEHGQTYVALSRCRSLEGIVLKQKIKMNDILTDDLVVNFYENHF